MHYHYFVEYPTTTDPDKISEHKGVAVLFASEKPVVRIDLRSGSVVEENVRFYPRPDVAAKQAHLSFTTHVSFSSTRTIRDWLSDQESAEVLCRIFSSETEFDSIIIPVRKYLYREIKAQKYDTIRSLVICPLCRGDLLETDTIFHCRSCQKEFPHNGNAIDFLPVELKIDFKIDPTDNVSDHDHREDIQKLIAENRDKIFVDIGAGFKYQQYPNVINLEIVDYPSTDILAIGEKLPIRSGSVDYVISSEVLEHVKDPFACAEEMKRILKPGGVVICAVPFLQPQHGYPHHYYNMTRDGLLNLFEGFEILSTDIPEGWQPMTAITWILGGYLTGLPEHLKKTFLNARVEELIFHFAKGKNSDHPLIKELSENCQIAHACTNRVWAKKPVE